MSGSASSSITVAAPPLTADVAAAILASMAAQSGVLTDFNVGSQIRTEAEAIGSFAAMQGIAAQALAFQAAIFGAFALFGITPLAAQPAVGTVTIFTGSGASPPPAPQSATIQAGTLVSTIGGTQFATTVTTTLNVGATGVNIPVQCVTPGAIGNVAAGAIVQIISGLSFGPLLVTNAAPTTGGANAELPAQTLARFTARVASVPGATPVAIANSVMGVTASGSVESVKYSTVFEPWVAQQAAGTTIVPGYQVVVDNGSGAASSLLLSAVSGVLNPTPTATGRDAGVPFSVLAVTPTNGSVVISGTAIQASLDETLQALAVAAVQSYQTSLQFGQVATQGDINTAVANAVAGMTTSLTVELLNSSGTSVATLTPSLIGRVIFTAITANFN
jgi:hypothetical protein